MPFVQATDDIPAEKDVEKAVEVRKFTWHGHPRGQGRPRFNRATGTAYKASEDRAFENSIAAAYLGENAGKEPFQGAVCVTVTICIPIPKTATKAAKMAIYEGKKLPIVKPDVDNVCKAVMDALNGVAYRDDKQVTQIFISKTYAEEPGMIVHLEGGEE